MSAFVTPQRPTLVSRAYVRSHRVNGQSLLVVQDLSRNLAFTLGAREWAVLQCMDGTRDVVGIARAVSRMGFRVSDSHVRAFVESLSAQGWLMEGSTPLDAEKPPEIQVEKRVDALALNLRCEGKGQCCRAYESVLFTPDDVSRARVHLPQIHSTPTDETAFLPERGCVRAHGLQAATMHDGHCAFLEDDLRCALHRVGGVEAKPVGCRHYPAWYVEDEEAVRAGPVPECACVFESVGNPGEFPLISALTHGALEPEIVVSKLPASIVVSPANLVSQRAFLQARSEGLERLAAEPSDALAFVLRRLDASPTDQVITVVDLLQRVTSRVRQLERWRSERDVVVHNLRWLQSALEVSARLPQHVSSQITADEVFYLRAVVHAHLLVDETDLSHAVSMRLQRMRIARWMAHVASDHSQLEAFSARHPLGVLEALMRSYDFDSA